MRTVTPGDIGGLVSVPATAASSQAVNGNAG